MFEFGKIKRIVLWVALALLGLALWDSWVRYDKQSTKATSEPSQQAQTQSHNGFVPQTFKTGKKSTTTTKAQQPSTQTISKVSPARVVSIKTDVLVAKIDTLGGSIISMKLPKYPVSLKEKDQPVQILTDNPSKIYVAQTGITNTTQSGGTTPIQYAAQNKQYTLQPGQNQLVVTLIGKTSNGLTVTKTYTFKRDNYAIQSNYKIRNNSSRKWEGSIYNQIVRRNVPVKKAAHSRTYDGASISSPKDPYSKVTFKDLDKNNLSRNIKGGWIAMQQHYFLSAWVPNQDTVHHYYSRVVTPSTDSKYKIYTVGYVSSAMTIGPNETATTSATLFVGPEVGKRLSVVAPGLSRTIDYGWLWWLSEIIFWLMAKVHLILGNWGWSIVIVTLIIKLVFYPLSAKSYKSMAKMRELAPRIKALKERLGDDKQEMSKATMELYKREKVNPMGGCLPLIIQIPVFFALYYVLVEAVQLRQAPFIFWIHDLSTKDPYYVLPILMGLSMLLQQKISPPPPDPMQAKMMMLLPVVFTIFFLTFPSGLVLYWLTNNLLSVTQQWWVTRRYSHRKKPAN